MTWSGAFETVLQPQANGGMGKQEDSLLPDAINRLADNLEGMNRILLRIENKT